MRGRMPKGRREGQDKTAVTILPAPPSLNPGVLIGRFRGRFVLIYRFGPALPGPALPGRQPPCHSQSARPLGDSEACGGPRRPAGAGPGWGRDSLPLWTRNYPRLLNKEQRGKL